MHYLPLANRKISRREFLKLVGAVGSGLALSTVGGFDLLGKQSTHPRASAQSAGSWSVVGNTSAAAIHASLMPDGKILYIAGSSFQHSSSHGPFKTLLLDPNTSIEEDVPLIEDLFCCGHTHLANGNLFVAGGTLLFDDDELNCNGLWHGLKATYEYDVFTKTLLPREDMAAGRWYPTCVTLPDGRILTVNGFDEYGDYNTLVEIYDPTSQSWSIKYDPTKSTTYCVGAIDGGSCPGAGSPCFGGPNSGVSPSLLLYPRMHLIPSGKVVTCGRPKEIRSIDPATGIWTLLGNMSQYRHYGSSFLLPLENTASEKGKICIVGGSAFSAPDNPATTTVEILDFNASGSDIPVIRTAGSLQTGRKYANPVILPDGKCVIFAGSRVGRIDYVYEPESFDPVAETWTTLPAATVARTYHGVAILLPDGRVWTASSTPTKTGWEPRIEIFSPGYYFETRPAISGEPTVADDGSTIVIPTINAASITKVSLVRLGSQTHHYDANQRLVWLQIVTTTSNSVTVSAPINNRIAPPGYYMIHVLNSNNIPSVAKIIKISGRTAAETFYDVPYPGNSSISLGSSTSTFRVGEQAYGSASQLIGKSLKEWTVYLKKTGSASGNVTAVVRRNSNDAIVATFNPIINASTLPTSFAPRLFTLTSPYTIQYGDRIMIEYTGPGSVDISIWGTDKFDGGNTRRTRYQTSYSSSSGSDVVGKMSTG